MPALDPVPVVYFPAPEQPLTPDELTRTIGTALDANPKLEAAVRQLFGQRLAYGTVDVASARSTTEERAHAGGRIAEILALQGEVARCLAAARSVKASPRGNFDRQTPGELRTGRAK